MFLLKLGSELQNLIKKSKLFWTSKKNAIRISTKWNISTKSNAQRSILSGEGVSNRILIPYVLYCWKFWRFLFILHISKNMLWGIFEKIVFNNNFLHPVQPNLYQKCIFFDKLVLEKVLLAANYVRNKNWKGMTSSFEKH